MIRIVKSAGVFYLERLVEEWGQWGLTKRTWVRITVLDDEGLLNPLSFGSLAQAENWANGLLTDARVTGEVVKVLTTEPIINWWGVKDGDRSNSGK